MDNQDSIIDENSIAQIQELENKIAILKQEKEINSVKIEKLSKKVEYSRKLLIKILNHGAEKVIQDLEQEVADLEAEKK